MDLRRFQALVLIGLLAAAAFSTTCSAQTLTWDANASTTGAQDGTGTWSATSGTTNWWNGTTNVSWADSQTAWFGAGGTAGTVTVSGSVNAAGLTFGGLGNSGTAAPVYTLSSGTINLGTGGTISLLDGSSQGASATISSRVVATNLQVAGAAGSGTSRLTLSGTNTLSGTITTSGGLILTAGTSALGSGADIVLGSSVSWNVSNAGTYSNNVSIGGLGIFSGRSVAVNIAGTTVLSGTVTLAGNAMLFGNAGGTLVLNNGVAEKNGSNYLDLQVGNNGTVRMLGKSTYSGTTFFRPTQGTANTLVLDGGDNTLPSSTFLATQGSSVTNKIVLGGTTNGAITQSVAGISSSGTVVIVGGASAMSSLAISVASGTNTYSGVIGGTATNENNVALVKRGAGTLSLTGTSYSYAGNTTISGGTLALGASAAALSNSPIIRIGDAGSSGAVFDLTARSGTYTFSSSQTVGGIGTINFGAGKTVASQGIWAPGNSIGSNAVTGNLSLTGTSQFELGSSGNNDFTSVSGTLTLDGNLTLIDNAAANSQGSYGAGAYRLFTAPSVSGTFASVTAPAGATTTRVGMVYTAGTATGQGVFANVYSLAGAAATQTVNVGNVYATNSSTTSALSVSNTAPVSATFTETLSGSFSGVTSGFSATGSVSGIAGGASNAGTLAVGLGSGLSAGVQTGTATLALFSNAVNSSGLAQQSVGSQSVTITGTVWNPAGVNAISPVTLTNVRVGGTFANSALTITNTAASGSYTEVLGATGTTSGLASLTGSVTGLGGNQTSMAISVGLGGSANTGSAGLKSGTATISFTSTGGPGTAVIAAQPVAVTGTVWNMAVGSITSGTTVNLGLIHAGGSFNSSSLTIVNTAATGGFSEGLNAAVSGSTGNGTFGGTSITNLAAGGTATMITVGLGDTATGGVKNGTITIGYETNGSTTSGLSTISAGSQVVNLTGSVFSGNGIWNAVSGGSWGSQGGGTNWTSTGGVQAAPGTFTSYASTDSAEFGGAVTGGTATITLGSANPSLAALTFNSGSASYQLSGGTLTLNGGTGTGLVTVSAGSHGIGSAVSLATSSVFSVANGSVLSLSGIVAGPSAGITKTGQGRLVLGGPNTYTGLTQVSGSGSELAINGSVAGNVQVDAGAVLGGSGVIAGNITGSGLIAPGNSPGILTVQGQLDATSTAAFAFEFSATGSPNWGNASASVNDVLRLTATSPFTSSLAATNVVNVYFDVTSLANGDAFLGGFFVDNTNSTPNLLATGLGSAVFEYFVKGDGNGGYGYNGSNYYSFGQFMAAHAGITGVTQSVVNVASANFTGGTITTGQVTQFVIVPEPGGVVIALVGIAGAAGWSLRRHRRRMETSS